MMLAYQPVRSLATLNVVIQQGLSGREKFYQLLMKFPRLEKNRIHLSYQYQMGKLILKMSDLITQKMKIKY